MRMRNTAAPLLTNSYSMRHNHFFLLSILSLALLFATQAADPTTVKPSFLGVFSNETEGFHIKTLMLDENGKGFYFAAVAGVPVLWKHNPDTNEITLTGPLRENRMTFVVRFDPAKREFTIMDPKYAEGSRPLRHITDDIPQQVRDGLKNYKGFVKDQ